MTGISRPRRERNNNASLETDSDTISLFPLAERAYLTPPFLFFLKRENAVSDFPKREKRFLRTAAKALFLSAYYDTLFSSCRIDFPRLRLLAAPPCARRGCVRRSERRKGAFFAPERRISPVAGITARRKVVPPSRRHIAPSIQLTKTASRTTEGIFKI